jgi:hypothetical protein
VPVRPVPSRNEVKDCSLFPKRGPDDLHKMAENREGCTEVKELQQVKAWNFYFFLKSKSKSKMTELMIH